MSSPDEKNWLSQYEEEYKELQKANSKTTMTEFFTKVEKKFDEAFPPTSRTVSQMLVMLSSQPSFYVSLRHRILLEIISITNLENSDKIQRKWRVYLLL